MTEMEETLQKLIRALEAGSYNVNPGDLFPHTATGEELDKIAAEAGLMRRPAACAHEWVEYVGMAECFSYCKHCDQKAVSDKK